MTQTPELLDRFEIVRILGRGGMGTVYLARDQRLGREVAVKVLNKEDLEAGESRARFTREARAAASIRHQNVATIYEVGETAAGEPFIVMEYCEGETLSQRIRRQPLSTGDFANIARQLAAGLAAAHDNGVIHRDLKTPNIIIERSGLAKILDFGLAKLLPREVNAIEAPSFASTTGQFFGTLHYLAPEQAAGGVADARTDLFSLGAVFYQMASGKLPFNAEAPLLVLEKIRHAEPEPFVPVDGAFPQAATRIISRLLQKNPEDRYQNAQELLRDLEQLDVPTQRVTTPSRSSLGRTMRRPQRARTMIAVAALGLVGAAIVVVRQQGMSPAPATPGAPPPPIRSMAVLPLNNLANSARDEFLSVSLADALVTKLQQNQSIQVRPTSAVLQFRDHKTDSKTASRELQVDSVLEGNFLAAGDLVRVNLQLTDSRSGYSVWATSVDGKRDNLLKLIDDVSARTVEGLNAKLGVQQSAARQSEARSTNPQAYEEYLKARAMTGSFVDFDKHVAALKRAIRLDPTFAAAYADLAIALSLGQARALTDESIQQAEAYARQAVRLDTNLPQAHLALGRVFVRYPDRYSESVREILAALRLNPNDTHALHSIATYFVSTGDMQNAECIGNRIHQIDPSSNEARIRGYWYINAVDPEGAMRTAGLALQSKDSELLGHDMRGVAFILQGNLVEAEREADIVTRMAPRHYLGKSLHAMIAAARGDAAEAEKHIRSFQADANRNHWAAIRVAHSYGKLGDREKAVAATRQAVATGHHSWYSLVKHPWLQSVQSDPEFQAMVAKTKTDLDDVRDDVIGFYRTICR
jgi:serine/threonine protein kinase/Flp pilus assembly protein TadD